MPPLTPEEQAALIRAFIGTGSGSNQINDLENLFGFSQNLLAQAAVGVPGVDAQYISDVVQSLSYQPYEGPDPLALQQDINVSLRALSQDLGLAPETVDALALAVAGGTPADVALASVAGTIYRDESGAPLLDVPEADKDAFNRLESVLSEYADAVRAEQNTFVWDGQRYIERDEADVRADMEQIGLTGQFNDPNIWLFQPDQALTRASMEAIAQSETQGDRVADLRSQLGRVGRDIVQEAARGVQGDEDLQRGIIEFFNRSVTPPTVEQAARDAGARIPEGATVTPPAPPRLAPQTDAAALLQRIAPGAAAAQTDPMEQFYKLTGGRYVTSGYGGADVQPKTPSNPMEVLARLAPGAAGADARQRVSPPQQEILDRQREAALQAANRYATFAAVEEAKKQVPAAEDALRQQITEAGAEQNLLSTAATQLARDATEQGSIPGEQLFETYRDYLTTAFPSVPSGGGGGRRRIRLSEDQIRSVARAAAGPLRRGMQ